MEGIVKGTGRSNVQFVKAAAELSTLLDQWKAGNGNEFDVSVQATDERFVMRVTGWGSSLVVELLSAKENEGRVLAWGKLELHVMCWEAWRSSGSLLTRQGSSGPLWSRNVLLQSHPDGRTEWIAGHAPCDDWSLLADTWSELVEAREGSLLDIPWVESSLNLRQAIKDGLQALITFSRN